MPFTQPVNGIFTFKRASRPSQVTPFLAWMNNKTRPFAVAGARRLAILVRAKRLRDRRRIDADLVKPIAHRL